MSRDAFFEEVTKAVGEQRYEPGQSSLESRVARGIVEAYLETRHPDDYLVHVDHLSEMVMAVENPQELLDETLFLLRAAGQRMHYHHADETLIVPLLQALHTQGNDRLAIDYGAHRPHNVWDVGKNLQMSDDRPLSVSYVLDNAGGLAVNLGERSKHVKIDAHGPIQIVGEKAKDASFQLERPPLLVGDNRTENCSFYIHGVERLSEWEKEKSSRFSMNYVPSMYQRPFDEYTLKAMCEGAADRPMMFLPYYFWEDDNSLYIPDADGWQEVRRE